jgi:replicative DNA helicase/DNA primase
MDFGRYKDRLKDYLSLSGIDCGSGGNISCFLPTHDGPDRNASLSIKDDHFRCYACGEKGDIYDMIGLLEGITDKGDQYKRAESLFDGGATPASLMQKKAKKKQTINVEATKKLYEYIKSIRNDHIGNIMSFAKERGYGKEFAAWLAYWPGYEVVRDAIGDETLVKAQIPCPPNGGKAWIPAGCVCRFESGWKLFYIRDGKTIKRASYLAKTFPYPKLPEGREIIIVEAEISALACINNGIPAVASGGTYGIGVNDLERLNAYNKITLCFDGDKAGIRVSEEKAIELINGGYTGSLHIAALGVHKFGNDPDDFIKSGNLSRLKKLLADAPLFILPKDISRGADDLPFRYLGFDEAKHYFLGRNDMVTGISAGKITSGMLLEIAPLEFWMTVKVNKEGRPDWTYINDIIVENSILTGPYKRKNTRGSGIWKDNGEIIASDGENIIHCGGQTKVKDYHSDFVYVRRPPMGIKSIKNELWEKDVQFLEWISEILSFATPQDGHLLFGWAISSLFLSVLSWRPIVYMKGPTSSGKTWAMNHIVRKILDGIAVCPKKNSTLIGIMQATSVDARMITVDELEASRSKAAQELIIQLMTAARDSTSESPELRYTGTADQSGMSNDFSSMFLFSSIVESSEEDQDVNRITPVNFSQKRLGNWYEVAAKIDYEMNNGMGDRLRWDAIYYRESIYENIKIFQKQAAAITSTTRNAEQLGTLIAGWYHLKHPGNVATPEEADEFIKDFDFSDQNSRSEGKTMSIILSPIMSHVVEYQDDEYGQFGDKIVNRKKSVYRILRELKDSDSGVAKGPKNDALQNIGIRYGTPKNEGMVLIAINHDGFKKLLPQDFPYKNNYYDYFKNHPAYKGKQNSVRYNGIVHQAMIFSINLADEGEEDLWTDSIPF